MSQNPLIYKIKVTAEWAYPGGAWYPYNRIFKEDLAMVEDIRSRFGMM
jgi:signal recognition particle subunit SEC65